MPFALNVLENYFQYLPKVFLNTGFHLYRNAYQDVIILQLAFEVGPNTWYHRTTVGRDEVIKSSPERVFIEKTEKLLAAKRTTQHCVKFFTGVNIC